MDAETSVLPTIRPEPEVDAQPARIRQKSNLRSPDIYGRGTVIRSVFSIRGLVRPGNSGGPLVSRDGDVLGVIFAAAEATESRFAGSRKRRGRR